MLKLRRPAMVNNYVNTVCVPGENETIPVNSTCYITGIFHYYFCHVNLGLFVICAAVWQQREIG